MALSVHFSLGIIKEIKRINSIPGYESRLEEFIFTREKMQSVIMDDLDDLFAEVQLKQALTKPAQDEKLKASAKDIINSLSAFASQDEQLMFDFNNMYDFMERCIEGLYWYDREILLLYLRLGNYRALEKDTGIPWESCYKTIQRIIIEIQNKAKEYKIELGRIEKEENKKKREKKKKPENSK